LIVFYPKSQAFITFCIGHAGRKSGHPHILAKVHEGKGG
jgi:hypothetical protein